MEEIGWSVKIQRYLLGYRKFLESFYSHPLFKEDPTQLRNIWRFKFDSEEYSFNLVNSICLNHIISLYEQDLPDKSHSGVVFTPPAIAISMCEITLENWIKKQFSNPLNFEFFQTDLIKFIESLEPNRREKYIYELFTRILPLCKILDPCVGGGEFIMGILNYILTLVDKWYFEFESKNPSNNSIWGNNLSKYEFISHFIVNNLHMVDLNPMGLELVKLRVWDELLKRYPTTKWGNLFSWKIPTIDHDFLTLPSSFPSDFQIILGNPPYLSSDSMSKYYDSQYITQLKANYSFILKRGSKPDLYFYFIAKAYNQLAEKGQMCFILPNRLLTNDYAIVLRQFLFSHMKFTILTNFNSEIEVFPNVNVHPCIFLVEKLPEMNTNSSLNNNEYFATEITDNGNHPSFSLRNYEYWTIPQLLAQKYNLLFSNLPTYEKDLLFALKDFPTLVDFVTIHEAKRFAHFEHLIDKKIPLRISVADYFALSKEKQNYYIREVRGKEIQENYLKSRYSFIQIPSSFRIQYSQESVLYIRELGEKIFCGFDWGQTTASMGYGGVYFVRKIDIKGSSLDHFIDLLALETFLSSSLTTIIYRLLFQAGSWGTALKIRSSYLHQLPYWIPNPEVFAELALWAESLQYFIHFNDLIPKEFHSSVKIDVHSLRTLFEKIKQIGELFLWEPLLTQFEKEKFGPDKLLYYWISTTSSGSIQNGLDSLIQQVKNLVGLIETTSFNSNILMKIQYLTNSILENIQYRIELFENNPSALILTKWIRAQIELHFHVSLNKS